MGDAGGRLRRLLRLSTQPTRPSAATTSTTNVRATISLLRTSTPPESDSDVRIICTGNAETTRPARSGTSATGPGPRYPGQKVIRTLNGHAPALGPGAFVHDAAEVIGRVRLGARASVWPGAVIRGDTEDIAVGDETNVQDGAVLHADPGLPCRWAPA